MDLVRFEGLNEPDLWRSERYIGADWERFEGLNATDLRDLINQI